MAISLHHGRFIYIYYWFKKIQKTNFDFRRILKEYILYLIYYII